MRHNVPNLISSAITLVFWGLWEGLSLLLYTYVQANLKKKNDELLIKGWKLLT